MIFRNRLNVEIEGDILQGFMMLAVFRIEDVFTKTIQLERPNCLYK